MRYLVISLTALTLASCNRDPNYLKQKYLANGNKYFAAGRLNEASIMYRRALEKDRKYGEAWYRLALTDLKKGSVPNGVNDLRRAVAELKPGTPESNDAILKLSEIYIIAAQAKEGDEALVKEVSDYSAGLLKRNPNSWEGLKLTGDLALLDAAVLYRKGLVPDAKKALGEAITDYRKALNSKPGDYTITLALGRSILLDCQTAEAEALFKSLVDKEKTNLNGYLELYRVYLQTRRLPEAEALLNSAIRSNPKETSLRLELARFYYATNKRDDLVALLNKMKADLKQFPQAYIQAGDFFIRLNQFDEAIKQ